MVQDKKIKQEIIYVLVDNERGWKENEGSVCVGVYHWWRSCEMKKWNLATKFMLHIMVNKVTEWQHPAMKGVNENDAFNQN